MLNRRHLRIKVLQSLYAYFQSNEENIQTVEKQLLQSIERIYDLYLFLLLSFDEIVEISEQKIEESKTKKRTIQSELEPNLKFVQNVVLRKISESKQLREASERNKVNWIGADHREMFKKIVTSIRENETYVIYMHNSERSFEEDKNLICDIFKSEIANSPLIYNFFEEKSIHWIDDIDLVCSMVLKTIKSIKEDDAFEILSLYKDEEDEISFVKTLVRKTIAMDKENLHLIDELTKNWELDRIARMDIILMKMAITELQVFPNIPKKVTLNEYIEISKFYSTPKSSGFINGILDKAVEQLHQENKIVKIGRGLMD
jgi:N utilization substance protein B